MTVFLKTITYSICALFTATLCVIHSPTLASESHQLQVAYVIPKGESPRSNYAEVITGIMTKLQKYYYEQLGVTFDLKQPLITLLKSPLPAKEAVKWDANLALIKSELYDDYIVRKNVVFSILEGTSGRAGGSINIVKMTGGFWVTSYKTYFKGPEKLENKLFAWSHELGHAFGLTHTEASTKKCLSKHGVYMGPLPSLIMQKTEDLGSLYNYPFANEEKRLLLDPNYYPDCRPFLKVKAIRRPHASKHLRLRQLPGKLSSSHKSVYQCTTPGGRVQFSDRPC